MNEKPFSKSSFDFLPRASIVPVSIFIIFLLTVLGANASGYRRADQEHLQDSVGSLGLPTCSVNIMPVGDSLTRGLRFSNDGTGWRRHLWLSLFQAGYDVDFVGSMTEPATVPPPMNPAPHPKDYDPNHEGHGGWHAYNDDPTKPNSINTKIEKFLRDANTKGNRPDVILLHIGTNDINTPNEPPEPEENAQEILAEIAGPEIAGAEIGDSETKGILQKIYEHPSYDGRPAPKVFLAQIIKQKAEKMDHNEWVNTKNQYITELNDLIGELPENETLKSKQLAIVDMEGALTYPDDLQDWGHPYNEAYEPMSDVWFDALQQYMDKQCGYHWVSMDGSSANGDSISARSGQSWQPSMVISPGGTPYIAWTDEDQGIRQIYVKRYVNGQWNGISGSATGRGLSDSDNNSWSPSLAVAPDGTPYVAWEEILSTNESGIDETEIYVRRLIGTNWEEVGDGNAANGIYSYSPSLAIDPFGTPILAWDAYSEIYVRQFDGTNWVEIGEGSDRGGGISNTGSSSYYFGAGGPVLAINPVSKRPIIAWEYNEWSDFEIYLKEWNGSDWVGLGGSASGDGLSDTAGDSENAQLAVSSDGTPFVAWTEYEFDEWDSQIYIRSWNGSSWVEVSNGSATGSGISNTTEYSWSPSLAISFDDVPVVAWTDYSNGDPAIFVRRWKKIEGTAIYGEGYSDIDDVQGKWAAEDWVEIFGGSASGGGISDSSSDSEWPTLVIAGDGMPVVAWSDGSLDDSEIIVKKLQYSSGAAGSGGQWDEKGSGSASGGGVSDNDGTSQKPALATSAADQPVLAWHDTPPEGSQLELPPVENPTDDPHRTDANYEIFVKWWNGTQWQELGTGSASGGGISDSSQLSWDPTVVLDAAGNPLVAWSEKTVTDWEIYLKRWNGSSWVAMGSGSDAGGGISDNEDDSWLPSIAMGEANQPILAWMDWSSGNAQIYVKRWTGSSWVELGSGSATGGGISANDSQSYTPSLAADARGQPVVAWHDYGDIFAQIYVRRWNGTKWVELDGSASGGGISNSKGNSYIPSVTLDLSGQPIVAWHDLSSGISQIYVRRWNGTVWEELSPGSASGAGISGASIGAFYPSVAVGSDGLPVVAWQQRKEGSSQIFIRRWNGTIWEEIGDGSATGDGISASSGYSGAPSLVMSAKNTPMVAWSDDSSGTEQIYLREWRQIYPLYFAAQELVPGLGWHAGMQVQNGGVTNTMMTFTGYLVNGTAVPCDEQWAAPGSSVTFLTDYGCPAGHGLFAASVISADQPTFSIANLYNRGVGLAGGQYRGMGAEDVARELFFPLVKNRHVGRTTGFFVQNASEHPSDILATFRVQGQIVEMPYENVPPFSSVLILPDISGVEPGFGQVGSLTVVSALPMAGASIEFDERVSVIDNLQVAKAFTPPEEDKEVYCPLYRHEHAQRRQTTGVQAQNVSEVEQQIDFTFVPVGDEEPVMASAMVAPGASATFYAPELGIPRGMLGSATIRGEEAIVAVVNDQGWDGDQRNMTTYNCFPAHQATKRVFVPLYKEMYRGNSTGIQIQNVAGDGSSATVTLTYRVRYSQLAVTFSHENPIPDGGSITFWGVSALAQPDDIKVLAGDAALLESTVGSVEITADQPVVAIVNEASYGAQASGQDAKNYEGFNR